MLLMLLSRLSLRVLPLIAALCAVVPAVGGRPLRPDEAWDGFGFTICDLPCFAGITPGRTPFQQTPTLLRKYIPLIQNHMFNSGLAVHFWASTPAYDLAGSTTHAYGVVDEIRLNSPVPLDHLIAELGMPDCILLGIGTTSHRSTIFWVRRQISIGAVLQGESLDLSARVPALWMYLADPTECARGDTIRWRGFAPLWNYARAAATG